MDVPVWSDAASVDPTVLSNIIFSEQAAWKDKWDVFHKWMGAGCSKMVPDGGSNFGTQWKCLKNPVTGLCSVAYTNSEVGQRCRRWITGRLPQPQWDPTQYVSPLPSGSPSAWMHSVSTNAEHPIFTAFKNLAFSRVNTHDSHGDAMTSFVCNDLVDTSVPETSTLSLDLKQNILGRPGLIPSWYYASIFSTFYNANDVIDTIAGAQSAACSQMPNTYSADCKCLNASLSSAPWSGEWTGYSSIFGPQSIFPSLKGYPYTSWWPACGLKTSSGNTNLVPLGPSAGWNTPASVTCSQIENVTVTGAAAGVINSIKQSMNCSANVSHSDETPQTESAQSWLNTNWMFLVIGAVVIVALCVMIIFLFPEYNPYAQLAVHSKLYAQFTVTDG